MATETQCPVSHSGGGGASNRDWWPNQLNLKVLHQNPPAGAHRNPCALSMARTSAAGFSENVMRTSGPME